MDYLKLLQSITGDNLIRIVLSKPAKDSEASGVRIRPIKVKEQILFQVTKSIGSKSSNTCKEVHENLKAPELEKYLKEAIPGFFYQGLFETEDGGYTVLANKKGTVTVVKNKSVTGKKASLDHNRTKKYIIEEGTKVPFMVDLGVMTQDGKIVRSKYDKFRQINRYLEIVADVIPSLDTSSTITVIDFGCGKSYLTFALYYYLVKLKGIKADIIGLDLKSDVIAECNKLKNKYKYESLKFIEGDIGKFEGVDKVDMVITLHACDTATDYALHKAITWGAEVIMAVPCCQHELNRFKNSPVLSAVSEYGILKERMSAIFTDAMRAGLLTQAGYDTQILEFIDMEHTPKNLLIRGVKKNRMVPGKTLSKSLESLTELAGGEITLKKLLRDTPYEENDT